MEEQKNTVLLSDRPGLASEIPDLAPAGNGEIGAPPTGDGKQLRALIGWLSLAQMTAYILEILLAAAGLGYDGGEKTLLDYIVNYLPFLVLLLLLIRRYPLAKQGQWSVRWPKPTVLQAISALLFITGTTYLCTPTYIAFALDQLQLIRLMPRLILNVNFTGVLSFSTFGTIVIAPIVEESIYRRLIQDRLILWGEGVAIALSAVFFSLVHMSTYRLLDTFLCGLVLGYVHAKTGRMRWNILLHMAVNALAVFLWCIPALYLLILAGMIYVPIYLIWRRPWRGLAAGDSGLSAGAKAKAWLTSVPFWICFVFYMVLILVFG